MKPTTDPTDGLNRELAALTLMTADGFLPNDAPDRVIQDINLVAAQIGAPYAFRKTPDGTGYQMHPDLLAILRDDPDFFTNI